MADSKYVDSQLARLIRHLSPERRANGSVWRKLDSIHSKPKKIRDVVGRKWPCDILTHRPRHHRLLDRHLGDLDLQNLADHRAAFFHVCLDFYPVDQGVDTRIRVASQIGVAVAGFVVGVGAQQRLEHLQRVERSSTPTPGIETGVEFLNLRRKVGVDHRVGGDLDTDLREDRRRRLTHI